ncbi:hypothetical protein [Enterobacter roggenkampii]|uniref:hypothetical protein n=2 Tax=Enterobacter roggenkampii TaxID=1812935 RepID=UPI003967C0B8
MTLRCLLNPWRFINLNKNNFDTVLSKYSLKVNLIVKNILTDDGKSFLKQRETINEAAGPTASAQTSYAAKRPLAKVRMISAPYRLSTWLDVYPKATLGAMKEKDAGMRIRVERELREEFLKICREQDRPAAQVIREFMREYIAAMKSKHAGQTENASDRPVIPEGQG